MASSLSVLFIQATKTVSALVNKYGYISQVLTLPDWNPSRTRLDTEERRRGNEKIQAKLFSRIAKGVETYLRKQKKVINVLAEKMVKEGCVKNEDLLNTIEKT